MGLPKGVQEGGGMGGEDGAGGDEQEEAKEAFHKLFGISWEEALSEGLVCNAVDSASRWTNGSSKGSISGMRPGEKPGSVMTRLAGGISGELSATPSPMALTTPAAS